MREPLRYTNYTTPVTTPVSKQLKALFKAVPKDKLLVAIIGSTRRGPKGHSMEVLFQCFLAKYVLGISSTDALIRTLENNPFIAEVCGVRDNIPHKSTFSRFFGRLADPRYLHLLKNVSRELVRHHYKTLPNFGKQVALDATTLKGWSNGARTIKADPEAGWCVKRGTHGTREYTYGWKLHLLVDCASEMPIAANISAGNVGDIVRASNVLSEARFTTNSFHPEHVIADRGYSSSALVHLIHRQYRAEPLIQVNPSHKKLMARWEEKMTPNLRAILPLRQSVERVFSRLKGQRSLNHITVRRKFKVTAHCYLALIAMQGLAIG